jgi:lysozyme
MKAHNFAAWIDAVTPLVQRWESFRAEPYDDRGHPAIGFGHTSKVGPPVVTPGMKVSVEEATAILRADLTRVAEKLAPLITISVTANQGGAILSWVYNVGITNASKSTLLRKLNALDMMGAANQFLVWDKSTNPKTKKKERLKGLTARRADERALFLKP